MVLEVFSSPCPRCRGHRPEGLEDMSRLLLQVLADVEDDGEGDEDDHDAKGKPGQEHLDECVEHDDQNGYGVKGLTLRGHKVNYKPDSRSDVH